MVQNSIYFIAIQKVIGQYHGCYIPYLVKEEWIRISVVMGVRFYGISDDMKISLIASLFHFLSPLGANKFHGVDLVKYLR